MRKLIYTILLIAHSAIGQNQINQTDKLETTAKIWGFLKYYHPNVADGKFDWDQQLLEILPKVEATNSKDELSYLYLNWINSFGEINICKNCSLALNKEYFDKNFDLSWIEDYSIFSKELSDKLKFIEQNRHQERKHYVSNSRVGNVNFTNEIIYNDLDWTDQNLRLLTLFRYWNMVEYFFPYKYQTDKDWDQVLSEMIPRFINTKDETDFHLAMLELVVSIDDSHGFYTTKKTREYFGNHWLPVRYKLIDNQAIITGYYNESLASENNLQIGDIITQVNNQNIETIFNQRLKYIYGSNLARKKYASFRSIFNGNTDSVEIEVIRNNQKFTINSKRYLFDEFNFDRNTNAGKFKILDNNIGYVNMGTLTVKDVVKMMKELKDTKGIIFDIRNYPKNTYHLIAQYISSKENSFFKVTYPDLDYPGKFIWKDGHKCGKKGKLKYNGKVILLVNESTQSHAEFTTMCLQTGDNVLTIGSQTSGADGNASELKMADGSESMITGIGIFYPDKSETQRKGVKIDIIIEPTIQGIIEKKDEVLEKAIELINQEVI